MTQEQVLGPDGHPVGERQEPDLQVTPHPLYEWTQQEVLEAARRRIPEAIKIIKQQADFRGEPLTGEARQALVLDMAVSLGYKAGKGELEK